MRGKEAEFQDRHYHSARGTGRRVEDTHAEAASSRLWRVLSGVCYWLLPHGCPQHSRQFPWHRGRMRHEHPATCEQAAVGFLQIKSQARHMLRSCSIPLYVSQEFVALGLKTALHAPASRVFCDHERPGSEYCTLHKFLNSCTTRG